MDTQSNFHIKDMFNYSGLQLSQEKDTPNQIFNQGLYYR